MTTAQRRLYFTQLWPDACQAQGWRRGDDTRRKAVVQECAEAIGAPPTDSTRDLGEAAITALFTYLRYLGNPDDFAALADWDTCRKDYLTWNTMKQGNWWRGKAGYKSRGKLDKQRFKNRPTSGLFDAPAMTAEEAEQYLMTNRARARAQAKRRKETRSDDPF